MPQIWIYTIGSVLLSSLAALLGIFTIGMKTERLKKILIYMISFSAGAMFGDAFLHLLPEVVEEHGFHLSVSLSILTGIVFFFLVEKLIHWRHCHMPITDDHVHPYAWMNLVGDGVHNFIDGIIIGTSYLVSIPVGIATTIAVILHEIPQEIADFGVLIHGGFSKTRALLINFLTALTSLFGAILALILSHYIEDLTVYMIPFAAGGFIYIAGSDLIPELHKEVKVSRSLMQILAFIFGIGVMLLLLGSHEHGHEDEQVEHDHTYVETENTIHNH